MPVVRQWRRHSLGHGWDAGCAVSGQVFRPLNLTDEFTCQALGIDIDSLPAERLCLLDQVKAWRALPMTIRVDNGPEFVAEALADWVSGTACCGPSSQGQLPEQLLDRAVQQEFREHILDGYPFASLDEVRDAAWTWLLDYAKK